MFFLIPNILLVDFLNYVTVFTKSFAYQFIYFNWEREMYRKFWVFLVSLAFFDYFIKQLIKIKEF